VLRLAEHIDRAGRLTRRGADALVESVAVACRSARDRGCDELLAFATSALRDARNGARVLDRVRRETGVDLQLLTGPDEARLTFLAVRRWFGWSAGRLLVLDIGGGSLELVWCRRGARAGRVRPARRGPAHPGVASWRPAAPGGGLSAAGRGRSDAGRAG
jgi:exopolyphosphatase/pppGpp-phosphohydrolase